MYELRTAGASRPALPFVLGLRCDSILYGTAASQVKVLCSQGAQYGSMICFYSADLRALAFLLLSHPEFSHKMRISTRSNKIFQCARRVIFSGGASHLTDSENAPVGRFPVTLWIIKIFLWNIFPQGCGWLCQPSQKIYAVFKQQKTVKALTKNGFIANFQSFNLNPILLFQIKQKAVYTDCFSVCASSYLPGPSPAKYCHRK